MLTVAEIKTKLSAIFPAEESAEGRGPRSQQVQHTSRVSFKSVLVRAVSCMLLTGHICHVCDYLASILAESTIKTGNCPTLTSGPVLHGLKTL